MQFVFQINARNQRVTSAYDASSRLVGQQFPTGRRYTFAHDAVNNRTLMHDATGRYTTTYSKRREVLTVVNPNAKNVTYEMTDPDGGRFTYAYDAAGRSHFLVNPRTERTTFGYDATGQKTSIRLANTSRSSFTYDAASRETMVHAESLLAVHRKAHNIASEVAESRRAFTGASCRHP